MIVVEEAPDAYTVCGADIQLAFRYLGDRWQHTVAIRSQSTWIRLLTSDEGSSESVELPSPALQDVRLERISEDVVEFQLLGQAGKGVYSAAVCCDGMSQVLDFDLSVRGRVSESPLCLQTGYRIGENGSKVSADAAAPDSVVVRLEGGLGVKLAPVMVPDHPPTTCRILGRMPARRIAAGVFNSAPPEPTNKGTTIRWRYRITPVGSP